MMLFYSEICCAKKRPIFFNGNDNLKPQFRAEIAKQTHFSLYHTSVNTLVWRISGPHISTLENLHAKPKSIFSLWLRAFPRIFAKEVKTSLILKKFDVNFAFKICPLTRLERQLCWLICKQVVQLMLLDATRVPKQVYES